MASLHDEVVAFVADWCGVPADRVKATTTIFGDLKVDGDDGDELLAAFAQRFKVDMRECDPAHYFGPEAGCLPAALVFWVIYAFRKGPPEPRAGLVSLRVIDLVRSAEEGKWTRARS